MINKQFIVMLGKYRKLEGVMVQRKFHEDILVRIFGQLHILGSHSPLSKKWKNAERRMYLHYCMKPYKMIQLGISKERL